MHELFQQTTATGQHAISTQLNTHKRHHHHQDSSSSDNDPDDCEPEDNPPAFHSQRSHSSPPDKVDNDESESQFSNRETTTIPKSHNMRESTDIPSSATQNKHNSKRKRIRQSSSNLAAEIIVPGLSELANSVRNPIVTQLSPPVVSDSSKSQSDLSLSPWNLSPDIPSSLSLQQTPYAQALLSLNELLSSGDIMISQYLAASSCFESNKEKITLFLMVPRNVRLAWLQTLLSKIEEPTYQ